jgi:hypothetical protein
LIIHFNHYIKKTIQKIKNHPHKRLFSAWQEMAEGQMRHDQVEDDNTMEEI